MLTYFFSFGTKFNIFANSCCARINVHIVNCRQQSKQTWPFSFGYKQMSTQNQFSFHTICIRYILPLSSVWIWSRNCNQRYHQPVDVNDCDSILESCKNTKAKNWQGGTNYITDCLDVLIQSFFFNHLMRKRFLYSR